MRAHKLRALATTVRNSAEIGRAVVTHMDRLTTRDMESLQGAFQRADAADLLVAAAEAWMDWRLGQCDSTQLDAPERHLFDVLTGASEAPSIPKSRAAFAQVRRNGVPIFQRIGSVSASEDGSLVVKLDAIPVSAVLHIRTEEEAGAHAG